MIYLDDVPVYPTQFPDKTSQVWKLNLTGKSLAQVTWNFESEAEFLQLAQIKTLLDSESIEATLKIDYLPYARQDKPVSNYATFGLHTFAKLLNTLRFNIVFLIDPHSKEAFTACRDSTQHTALRIDTGILARFASCWKIVFRSNVEVALFTGIVQNKINRHKYFILYFLTYIMLIVKYNIYDQSHIIHAGLNERKGYSVLLPTPSPSVS